MWRTFLLVFLSVKSALPLPEPGLLRVPKVYNAVITSNQNLAPSRAYPVIQPLIHRTAIGYVPPFYYGQIAPGFAGPGVVQLDPGTPTRPDEAESRETFDSDDSPDAKSPPKRISKVSNERDENEEYPDDELSSESSEQASSSTSDKTNNKKDKNNRVPLRFYPNYRSVYYDPYFNAYNPFPPNFQAPGTYYVDYPRPPRVFGPVPFPVPFEPSFQDIPVGPQRPGTSTNDGEEEGNDRESMKHRSDKSRTSDRRGEKATNVDATSSLNYTGKKKS